MEFNNFTIVDPKLNEELERAYQNGELKPTGEVYKYDDDKKGLYDIRTLVDQNPTIVDPKLNEELKRAYQNNEMNNTGRHR